MYHIGRNKWELIYGLGYDDETPYTWHERFDHEPTPKEVRDTINAQIDANTDEEILHGFSWNGVRVILNSENQFNFKAAYDLAYQTEGATLPVTLKLGDDFATFDTINEFSEFYMAAMRHVQDAYAKGWKEKNSVDWAKYDIE